MVHPCNVFLPPKQFGSLQRLPAIFPTTTCLKIWFKFGALETCTSVCFQHCSSQSLSHTPDWKSYVKPRLILNSEAKKIYYIEAGWHIQAQKYRVQCQTITHITNPIYIYIKEIRKPTWYSISHNDKGAAWAVKWRGWEGRWKVSIMNWSGEATC